MKILKLILFTCLIYSCNQNIENKLKPDDDFGLNSKMEGEFIGEFDSLSRDFWSSLVFKNGNGKKEYVFLWIGNGDVNTKLKKLTKLHNYEEYTIYNCSDNLPFSSVYDSIMEFPEMFVGKLFKVKWSKFMFDYDESPMGEPILISISSPNQIDLEKVNQKENSTPTDENNLKQENDSRLTIGEIRGMVYGSTLSQVEEEIGCIDYNWEGENNSENDCPGKRLQVNSGLRCLDYNFVVYKNFVLNSKKEVSDLLIVVKDWGKTYSKVTYVGIFNGKLDPYEHCQDR